MFGKTMVSKKFFPSLSLKRFSFHALLGTWISCPSKIIFQNNDFAFIKHVYLLSIFFKLILKLAFPLKTELLISLHISSAHHHSADFRFIYFSDDTCFIQSASFLQLLPEPVALRGDIISCDTMRFKHQHSKGHCEQSTN